MKVCITTSSFPVGRDDAWAAAGLFVRDFACVLADSGVEVTVLTPDRKSVVKEPPDGVNVVWFPWYGGSKRLSSMHPWNPLDMPSIGSLLSQGSIHLRRLHDQCLFDHVLAMWAVPAGVFARGLWRARGVPYSVWCLGSDINVYGRLPLLRGVVRSVLRDAVGLFADGLELARRAGGLCGRDCLFLASARKHACAVPTARQGIAEAGPHLLFVGRLARVKGADVLVRAMHRYVCLGGKGTLTVLGDGPLGKRLRSLAAKHGLGGRIDIARGFVSEAELLHEMGECDAVVIPSRSESIPLILGQSAQAGRPLIVSDVGDMGTLVAKAGAGVVVAAGDPDALARAMLLLDTEGCGGFRDGVARLADQFDLKRSASKWLEAVGHPPRGTH